MPLEFYTKNLNKRFYRRMVENVLLNYGVDVYQFLQDWTIKFHPLSSTDTTFYEHVERADGAVINPNMPSGVTGQYVIDLYLHDDDNRLKSRENDDRLQHELAHAVLFGTPHFVKGVHDNEDKRFKISFWFWNKIFWSRWYMNVIDIREFL
jgi:hypothetical protein